jgi:hypothetical protein
MEGLEQRLDGASWETGRLPLESPIGRELSNFPAETQRIISRARLRSFQAIPRGYLAPLGGQSELSISRPGCREFHPTVLKWVFHSLPAENCSSRSEVFS